MRLNWIQNDQNSAETLTNKNFQCHFFVEKFSNDSDNTLFGFLAVCCLCFAGMAFGLYIGNEELSELINTLMRIISHTE